MGLEADKSGTSSESSLLILSTLGKAGDSKVINVSQTFLEN